MPVFYGNQLLDDDQIYLKLTDTTPLNSATFSGVQGQSVFAFDYVRGLIDVKLNGKRLKRSAYTATNGTSVTLATPIASNYDVLTIDGFIIEGSQNAAGNFLAYGGTANAITLTSNNAQPAKSYKDGAQYRFRATTANTGATTISVDGLPAKACKTIAGEALSSGNISTDIESVATYYASTDCFVVVSGIGTLPSLAPRAIGDGVETVFASSATAYASPNYFTVTLDGVKQRPVTDYDIDLNGNVVLVSPAPFGAKVDIIFYNADILQVVSSSNATVTATPSGVSKTLGEWTEYLATPETIEVTATGTTTARSLGDRFGDVVNIVDFGAQVWPFDSTSAFANAISTGASVIHIPSGIWKLTALPPLSSGQTLVGAGVDMWDHLDPNPLLKSWSRGTHLVFVGTGSKDKQLAYNNAGITSGGVLQNTDSINSNDTEYSLYNFYNTDGDYTQPATKKLFSAAVHVKPYATNVRLKDLRIVPNFNCMDGYIDGNTVDLSDDWGVGVFVDNAAWVELDNVQVVGYWRIAAVLAANKNDEAYLDTYGGANSAGRAYHSRIYNCVLQGHTGLMLRGGSVYKSLNVTSNSFEIEFDSSHFFSPFGTVSTPKGEFTYTSLSQSGSNIVFNGVTPDPVAAGLGNGPIRKGNSVGMGGITISKCLITGLDHSSGVLATSAYLSMSPSKALEIDGSFRMITFDMNYVQTKEDVLVHCHNVDDLRFIGGQIEANDYRLTPAGSYSATHGGRMLFSPQDTANTITNASGSSKVTFDRVHMAPYVDLFPFIDRDTDSKFASTGMFTPRTLVMTDEQFPDSDNLDIEGLNGQDVRIRAKSGNSIILRNVNGDNALRVSSAGTVLIENGPFTVNGGSATFSGGSVTISGGNLFVSSGKQLTFSGGGAFINKDAGQSLYLRTGTTIDVEITSSGVVKMPRLPTSAPAESGSLWNNGGILNIVT